MKIGILGTGSVGRTLAEKLVEVGHSVIMGTRNVEEKLKDDKRDQYGGPSFSEWQLKNPEIPVGTFGEAAEFGELIINATKGSGSLEALKMAGHENLAGKVILDLSNPLDASKGMPPSLITEYSNTNSLGEEIQRQFPTAQVVKTLNTMWAGLMVNPGMINHGDHTNFICGNDLEAKVKVRRLLGDLGWGEKNIMDLGDITSARGTESYLPFWLRIFISKNNGAFNIKVVE
jgi:predicted dinucleotide-binding enzyme